MASQGPLGCTIGADNASQGTVSWGASDLMSSLSVVVSTDDSLYALASCGGATVIDLVVKIVKGGSISGTDLATGAALDSPEAYASYGGSSNLWGLTWTSTDINASNFGLAYSATSGAADSHFLVVTGFGFSIPAGATINGILMEVKQTHVVGDAKVNYVRATVFYTAAASGAFGRVLFVNQAVKISTSF